MMAETFHQPGSGQGQLVNHLLLFNEDVISICIQFVERFNMLTSGTSGMNKSL